VIVLRTEQLYKAFGKLVVTDNVSLSFARGERHAIIGPNGAGKTSFLHQLGGQLTPSSGRIFLGDRDITQLPPERRCRLGLARTYQKNNLFLNLSVFENVRLAVQAHDGGALNPFTAVEGLTAQRARTLALIAQVRLDCDVEMPVRHLSYGAQRQIEIAMALAAEPAVLLLDEPTAGMSPAETERMVGMIGALDRDICIVLVEHDMDVVFSLAQRITVLHYGAILASGTPADISDHPDVRAIYLGMDI
jgi:branched-chain amino acid transport system ATP-binding protein